MKELIEKYGNDMIDLVIKIDDLIAEEVNDTEYLEDRIITHLEWCSDEFDSVINKRNNELSRK